MASNPSTASQQLFEGETPSPLCNHLLEQARLRYEGELEEQELKDGVTDALGSIEQAREETLKNLEQNQAVDDVVDAFERSFEEMQLALEELHEFAGEPDEESYQSVRTSIHRAAAATVFAMSILQQSQFADGPTDMPLFNALFKMKDNYLEGHVAEDQLTEALSGIVEMTKAAIKELLEAEGEQPPQRDGLVRAYEEQIASLKKAGESVSVGDKERIEEAFAQLLRTSEGVKEAMLSLTEAVMGEGPCRLRRTNILLSALESLRTGQLSAELFALSFEAYESEIREERARFQELISLPNQSEAVSQEVEKVRQAYELHEKAFEHFLVIIDGEAQEDDFEKASKAIIEASEKLSDCKEALTELGESEGKVSCVRCGTLNDANSRVCEKCSAQLPQQAGGMVSSTMSYQESDGQASFQDGELEMTTNLERLFVAVNEVAEGKSTDDEFNEILEWMDGLLEAASSTMPEVPVMTNSPDYSPELIEQIELLQEELGTQRGLMLEGMNDFRAALGTLQSFLSTREKDNLIKGVREVQAAAIKMQKSEKALVGITQAIQHANAERERMEAEQAAGGAPEPDQEG